MEKMCFNVIHGNDQVPNLDDNNGCVIAFVYGEGFQMCKYYNGSKTWQSIITNKTVHVTDWLQEIKNERI